MLLSLWFACGALCKTIKTKLVLEANDKAEHSKQKACLTLSFKKLHSGKENDRQRNKYLTHLNQC